jgi:soluble lytic murein transglycosylase-like protein
LALCFFAVFCITFTAVSSSAAYYSWVDDQGILHLTNVSRAKIKRADAESQERFGGYAPIVLKVSGGQKRRVYRVNVTKYDPIIRRAANHYRLPFPFVKSIVKVESNFNPKAVSKAKAKGLMQLMDATAKDMSVVDSFDPEQNIFGGTRYLRLMANRFDGDIEKTAAAYNAGPRAVQRARGVPDFRETKRYVARVKLMFAHYNKLEAER